MDEYIVIHEKSGDNKHYYAIFECKREEVSFQSGIKNIVVFGQEIISHKQSGYQGIIFIEGSESDERRFFSDSFFDTLEDAYRDLIIEVFYD